MTEVTKDELYERIQTLTDENLKLGRLERYMTFSPLVGEEFIYPLEIYRGKIKGNIFKVLDKEFIEIRGE